MCGNIFTVCVHPAEHQSKKCWNYKAETNVPFKREYNNGFQTTSTTITIKKIENESKDDANVQFW